MARSNATTKPNIVLIWGDALLVSGHMAMARSGTLVTVGLGALSTSR